MIYRNRSMTPGLRLNRYLSISLIGIALFIMASFHIGYGQTQPNFNHYLFNNYLINPAVVGIEDYIDIKSSVRSQWNGLEGSPETLLLTAHGNIQSKIKQNPANPQKPVVSNLDNYTVDLQGYNARPHHGVGGLILADKIGPFTKIKINGSFAYHIPLSKKYRLSAGLSLGFIHNRLDRGKITLQNPDDNALSGEKYTNTNPDLGIGLWFYSRSLFVGVSGNQLFRYNVGFGDYNQGDYESYQHFIGTVGYKFIINYNLMITPSFTIKSMQPAPMVIDYNMVFSFINRVSLGLTYRNNNEYVVGVRFIANPVFEFGYFFDYGGASVDRYNQGSHELYLGLRLLNKNKILCPVLLQ